LHQIRRDADGLCIHIYLGAVVGKDFQRFAGWKMYADLVQQVQRAAL
jgi:hypothetical protein